MTDYDFHIVIAAPKLETAVHLLRELNAYAETDEAFTDVVVRSFQPIDPQQVFSKDK